MKQGRTLQELAVEIDRQARTKKDFLVDTSEMSIEQVVALIASDIRTKLAAC